MEKPTNAQRVAIQARKQAWAAVDRAERNFLAAFGWTEHAPPKEPMTWEGTDRRPRFWTWKPPANTRIPFPDRPFTKSQASTAQRAHLAMDYGPEWETTCSPDEDTTTAEPFVTSEEHIENLRAALAFFDEWADMEDYGGFPGGDPRLFKPDPECSSEEERAAHKVACETWDRSEHVVFDVGPLNSEEIRYTNKSGKLVVVLAGTTFVQNQVFGLGTIRRVDPKMVLMRDAIRVALAEYEKAVAEKSR